MFDENDPGFIKVEEDINDLKKKLKEKNQSLPAYKLKANDNQIDLTRVVIRTLLYNLQQDNADESMYDFTFVYYHTYLWRLDPTGYYSEYTHLCQTFDADKLINIMGYDAIDNYINLLLKNYGRADDLLEELRYKIVIESRDRKENKHPYTFLDKYIDKAIIPLRTKYRKSYRKFKFLENDHIVSMFKNHSGVYNAAFNPNSSKRCQILKAEIEREEKTMNAALALDNNAFLKQFLERNKALNVNYWHKERSILDFIQI